MGIIQRPRHTDTDWLAKVPIGPYVDAFKQHLAERGYAAHTFASYVVGITHFARWARTKRLRLNRVDEASIADFLTTTYRTANASLRCVTTGEITARHSVTCLWCYGLWASSHR